MTSSSPFYGFNDLSGQVTTANINSCFQVMEDPLQSQRLKYAFESDKGLLGESHRQKMLCHFVVNAFLNDIFPFLALMHQSNNVDSRRCYQCVKFLVTLAQK